MLISLRFVVLFAMLSAASSEAQSGRIAFMSGGLDSQEIHLINVDGSNELQLTTDSGIISRDATFDSGLSWSPDGQRIAFGAFRNRNTDIFAIDVSTKTEIRLTDHGHWDGLPSWSPDGSRIAFSSTRDGSGDIFIMDADGANPVNLTSHPADEFFCAWSPDGSRIAFGSNRDTNWEIYVIDVGGSNLTNLTDHPGEDRSPAWSPDSERIVFQSDRDGDWDIYVMAADGSSPVNLTDFNPLSDGRPSWSPDGTIIAYTSERPDLFPDISLIDPQGKNPMILTNRAKVDATPVWSPNLDIASLIRAHQWGQIKRTIGGK